MSSRAWRLGLLALGGVGLLAGLSGALVLLGVWTPAPAGHLAASHGLLMTLGFLGTLIALERAVALGQWWGYLAPLAAGIGALALIGGAYLSHSVHAGIVSIGNGQWQAAMSLGLTRWQALREVVLPQAVRVMMPSFVNQWVSLIKDTSLAYIVGVPEFTFLANQLNNRLMVYPAQIFLFVGFVYLMLCGALQALAHAHLSRRSAERSRVRTMPAMQRRKARL